MTDGARHRLASASRSGPALSRRSLLRGGLGAGGLLTAGALTGCVGGSVTTGPEPLVRTWDLLSGSDGQLMDEILGGVRQDLPDVTIHRTTLDWGQPYYTKLAMAAAGQRAPETAVLHLSRLLGYAPGGLLEPFDLDLLAEVGITPEDFPPALWERTLFEGQPYALPFDTHPVVFFYNPEVAEEAGLLAADGSLREISSADGFLDAGRALAEVTGHTGIAYGYLNDEAQAWRLFWGLFGQNDGEFDLTPGRQADLDDAAAIEVVEFMQSMLDGTVTATNSNYDSALANFSSGRSGAIISGEWELNSLREAVPDVAAVPIPTIFDIPAAFGDSHSYVLPRQRDTDPDRRRATYEYLAALLHRGNTWAQAGHIPALTSIVESAEYQSLEPQSDYAVAAERIFLDPPVWFSGAGSAFQTRMSQAMMPALQGRAPAEDAVRQMVREMNILLETPAPA